jgi:hypothetical protein
LPAFFSLGWEGAEISTASAAIERSNEVHAFALPKNLLTLLLAIEKNVKRAFLS